MYSLECVPSKHLKDFNIYPPYPTTLSSRFPSVSARVRRFVCSSYSPVSTTPINVGLQSYYRLGKNRCGSGILSRYSRLALRAQAIAVMPVRTPTMMAVFALQFAGCAYQPPAGDQTCLGYLRGSELLDELNWSSRLTGSFLLLPL